MHLLALAFAAVSGPALPADTWLEHYERGVALVEEGRAAEARAELEAALELRSEEGLWVPVQPGRYLDYLPHLYLAIACHGAGDLPAALEHLAAAERSGIAARSEVGARLLAAFQVLLNEGSAPEPAPSAASPPDRPLYQVYERKPPLLTDEEFGRIQREVLDRCRLKASNPERAPWYYHYELGLELARRGDSQRALDALVDAANLRPRSRHLARIYGIWFIDYLPYLKIAWAHARLGNRECARDALRLSAQEGELADRERELAELRALLDEPAGKAEP
jgi:hypothetical protein